MQTTVEETAINQKTRELCQAILDQPEMQSMRQRIDAFMASDASRSLYDGLVTKGQALQQKQQMALALTEQEIEDFEKHRTALMNDPVARGFMDAQEEMHHLQGSIQQYVSKTLELGRLPTEDDLNEGGGCGHGCGCKH